MNNEIRLIQPKSLWNNFTDLNAVPRPSKEEDKVIDFLIQFSKKLNLNCFKDSIGNLIINKPSTDNMKNCKTIVLQSHVDMVHEKNNDVDFDFKNSGINMHIDGDWVKARGTTLGADNGLGVASIMAILQSDDIPHPKIEALFTIDEETGMTGALNLDGGALKGEILLNLDTEEDDEICIGCAGGIDVNISKTYMTDDIDPDSIFVKILINGLTGGHSGAEIHKGLGNSNKILNSLIKDIDSKFDLRISEIKGGNLRNAIPRESYSIVQIKKDDYSKINQEITNFYDLKKTKYKDLDPNFSVTISKVSGEFRPLAINDHKQLIECIEECPNGVFLMSKTIDNLVETSNNLASILVRDGSILIKCLARSSVENSKSELSSLISNIFKNKDFEVKLSGGYPGWEPNMNSEILSIAVNCYKKLYNESPKVNVIHAGLECGIIGSHYPNMEMISFGPTILGAHSPDEKASISSTKKFWSFLIEILKNIPKRD